jgi:hypothetical protein
MANKDRSIARHRSMLVRFPLTKPILRELKINGKNKTKNSPSTKPTPARIDQPIFSSVANGSHEGITGNNKIETYCMKVKRSPVSNLSQLMISTARLIIITSKNVFLI